MKVRWVVSATDPKIASVRIRALAIIRALRRMNVDADVLNAMHAGVSVAIFCKTYRREDIELARRLRDAGATVIFDLCDNHFVNAEPVVSRLREMMRLAHVWVFSTPALQAIAVRYLGEDRDSVVIPDAVEQQQRDWDHSPLRRWWYDWEMNVWRNRQAHQLQLPSSRLIWFGNHMGSVSESGMSQLTKLRPLLEECAELHQATLTVVSDSRATYRRVLGDWRIPTSYLQWNLATFIRVLQMHSIALIPFDGSEFNAVKSNNRLALSVYHGVAVVADAIPSYQEFADCAMLTDWSQLHSYLRDEELRQRHVSIARARVAEKYSLDVVARQWLSLLASQQQRSFSNASAAQRIQSQR